MPKVVVDVLPDKFGQPPGSVYLRLVVVSLSFHVVMFLLVQHSKRLFYMPNQGVRLPGKKESAHNADLLWR